MDKRLIKFNSHTNHNPDCDIVCYQLDKDTNITYGIYVNNPKGSKRDIKAGDEFMEVYVGENYNVGSRKRSYSRVYYRTDKMPKDKRELWFELRMIYQNELQFSSNDDTVGVIAKIFNRR